MARETDVEHTLGTVETEAGTLSTGDQECGHLALAQEDFAGLFPEVVAQVVDCGLEQHRLQVARNVVVQRGVGLFGIKSLEFFPVLAFDVAFQGLAGIAAQRFKLGNQLLLTCRIQSFDNVHIFYLMPKKITMLTMSAKMLMRCMRHTIFEFIRGLLGKRPSHFFW